MELLESEMNPPKNSISANAVKHVDSLSTEQLYEIADGGVYHKRGKNHSRKPRHEEEQRENAKLRSNKDEVRGNHYDYSSKNEERRDVIGERAADYSYKKSGIDVSSVAYSFAYFRLGVPCYFQHESADV